MARLHALEMLPDDAGQDAVRRDWQALRDAGLPSMLDHRGATNAPHVTVLAAPALDSADEDAAAELLGPVLPTTARATGLVLFGGARGRTLARLLEVDDDVVRAVLDLRPAGSGGWVPHVTLARRLAPDDVPRALAVLPDGPALTLATLRRWDPEQGTVHPVVGPHVDRPRG